MVVLVPVKILSPGMTRVSVGRPMDPEFAKYCPSFKRLLFILGSNSPVEIVTEVVCTEGFIFFTTLCLLEYFVSCWIFSSKLSTFTSVTYRYPKYYSMKVTSRA